MHLEITRDVVTGDLLFRGRVCQKRLARLPLDNFDMRVLHDCDPAEVGTDAADCLLALELIFRKARPVEGK